MVMKPFDVAAHDRPNAQSFHPAVQVQDHPRLVAFRIRKHNPGPSGICLQDRTQRTVKLGIHRDEMLAILYCTKRDSGAELYRAGHLNHDIHRRRIADMERILGHSRNAFSD